MKLPAGFNCFKGKFFEALTVTKAELHQKDLTSDINVWAALQNHDSQLLVSVVWITLKMKDLQKVLHQNSGPV